MLNKKRNVDIIFGAKVTDIDFNENGTTSVRFTKDKDDVQQKEPVGDGIDQLTSKLVFACDGRNSVALKALNKAEHSKTSLVRSRNGWCERPRATPTSDLCVRSVVLNETALSAFIEKLNPETKPYEHSSYTVLRGSRLNNRPSNRVFDISCSGTVQFFIDSFGGRIGSMYADKDHEIWSIKTVSEGYDLFCENFPLLSEQDIKMLITEESMHGFICAVKSVLGPVRKSGSLVGYVGAENESNKGAVVLLGDALHSFPPDLGLGVNSGFEDVGVLTSVLENAENNNLVQDIARTFEVSREDDVRSLIFCVTHGRSILYNQLSWKEPFKYMAHRIKMPLNKLFPNVFHLPIGILMVQDLSFTEIRRRSIVTTRRIWYVVLTAFALILFVIFQLSKVIT